MRIITPSPLILDAEEAVGSMNCWIWLCETQLLYYLYFDSNSILREAYVVLPYSSKLYYFRQYLEKNF